MPKNRIYPYIDDTLFVKEVAKVLGIVDQSLQEINEDFTTNVLDPFSAIFEAASKNISYEDWIEQEKYRQVQKTLQNAIGHFHQNIVGLIGDWKNTGQGGGYDVENVKQKVFAEIKNKYNTFNSSSSAETYNKMVRFLKGSKKGYIGYVVIIIPRKATRYQKPFVPGGVKARKDLVEIDGASFYEMVTGDKNSLKLLFEAVPVAVKKIRNLSDAKFNPKMESFLNLFIKAFGN